MFSERTEDQVEKFLAMAPSGPSTGTTPGLRVFYVSQIEAGDLLALFVAGCAALFLIGPGAYWLYSSLQPSPPSWQLLHRALGLLALLSLAWVLFLYSLAFSRNAHSYDVQEKEITVIDREAAPGNIFIGDFSRWGLRGLAAHWTAEKLHYPLRRMGDRLPEIHFMTYQLAMFLVAVVPLLVVTGRGLRSGTHLIFWLLWSTLVYAPLTYWTQGGGWLAECIDSGSAVSLHMAVGFTALGLMLLAPASQDMPPGQRKADPAATASRLAIGGLLFVAGSVLLAGSRAIVLHPSSTFDLLNVFLSAGVGLLAWMGLQHRDGRSNPTDCVFGAVSGIAAIAAGCSSVSPGCAIIIAAIGTIGSYTVLYSAKADAVPERSVAWRLFAVHGVSALLGLVLVGVFASADVAGAGISGRPVVGLIGGNLEQWRVQVLTGAAAALVALAAGYLLPQLCNLLGLLFTNRTAPRPTVSEARVDEPLATAK
jgi:Amt family ammonium transporter